MSSIASGTPTPNNNPANEGRPLTDNEVEWQQAILEERRQFERFSEHVAELVEIVRPLLSGFGATPLETLIATVMFELERAFSQPMEQPRRGPWSKAKVPDSLRTAVYERDEYACVTCGVRKNLSLDHIIPESKGGPTTYENLQVLCRSHNSRKGVSSV